MLGMGSFGAVHLGFNNESGELMAIKRVHIPDCKNNSYLDVRFFIFNSPFQTFEHLPSMKLSSCSFA